MRDASVLPSTSTGPWGRRFELPTAHCSRRRGGRCLHWDMAKLVPKTSDQLLSALEDHLFLLAQSLHGLSGGDAAFLRELAGKLRAIVCYSKGLDGLLWRVCDEVGADDMVHLRYPGKVDATNPLTRGLGFVFAPVAPDGSGDERVPVQPWRLRDHIKTHEALYVDGESVIHEDLISAIANESGIAHEANGVSKVIAKVNDILFGDVQPYFSILDTDARLALEVGERVIVAAVANGYARRRAPASPPPLIPLHSKRFGTRLDVPKAGSRPGREGSAMFLLDMTRVAMQVLPIRFPPMTLSGVVLTAQITRRGRLAIAAMGLPLPMFGCECAIPESEGTPIVVIITWKATDIRVYAAGKQIAGIRSPKEAEAS